MKINPQTDTVLTVDGERCRRPEFVWREPLMEPVLPMQPPFYMDTEENKRIRYEMVCAGFSDNPLPPPPKFRSRVRFMVRDIRKDTEYGW